MRCAGWRTSRCSRRLCPGHRADSPGGPARRWCWTPPRARSFATNPYLSQRRPRSALCLPIVRQAKVVGLLYLENKLAPAAFTPERLAALELLAAQAAISLENASLLRREQAARAASEAAVAGRFLSDASALCPIPGPPHRVDASGAAGGGRRGRLVRDRRHRGGQDQAAGRGAHRSGAGSRCWASCNGVFPRAGIRRSRRRR